jgi:hypothetical protein
MVSIDLLNAAFIGISHGQNSMLDKLLRLLDDSTKFISMRIDSLVPELDYFQRTHPDSFESSARYEKG